jgi:hypothetical protein
MYTPEQKGKLSQLFTESIAVYKEVEDLNAGLSDTIKAVAEELEVKPAVLKKAIKIAQKSNFTEVKEDHETIEDLLATVGRSI